MSVSAATPPANQPSALSVFRNRNFTLLWFAQLVSMAGTSLTSLAASIYVYKLTGSALNVGLMLMATVAPSLFVGLVAGVLVDRLDRRRIMIAADVIRACLLVTIPFLLPYNIAWLYLLIAASAAVGQFFEPAHASVLPELANEEELNAANSMIAISSFGASTIGLAAAGLITSRYPIEWAFYLDAFTFAVSGILIALARIPRAPAQDKTSVSAVSSNLRAGLSTIRTTPVLRSLFIVYIPTFILFGLNNTLVLPYALDVVGVGEATYGMIEALSVVGLVLGSLFMAQYGNRLREGQWITTSFVGMGVTTIGFALSSFIPLLFLFDIMGGFFNAPSVVARSTLIQRSTAREMRGRVFSAFFVTRDIVFMLGMALAGLADYIGARPLLLIAGFGTIVVAAISAMLPGLGTSRKEWAGILHLLGTAPAAPAMGPARAATRADFDLLVLRQPVLSRIDPGQSERLLTNTSVRTVEAGAAIVRQGDPSNAAYFILDGRAIAGVEEDGTQRILEIMNPGDFFGEIAALTGSPRTANVIAEVNTTLLEVPAEQLRELAADPQLGRVIQSQMSARMQRSSACDIPRIASRPQEVLLDLRTPIPEEAAA